MITAIDKKNKDIVSSTDSTLSKIYNYLKQLANSTINITEFAKIINVHRTTVWRNMRKLEIAGLIRTKRIKNGIEFEMLHDEYSDDVEKIRVVARNKTKIKSNVAYRNSNKFEMLHLKYGMGSNVAHKSLIREEENELSQCTVVTGLDSNVASDVARHKLYNNLYIPTKIPKLNNIHSDILVGNREADKTSQSLHLILASMLHVRKNTSKGRQICSWIRNWVDLSAYLIANGVTVYRENSSGETPCHCPFHDDRKPSFFVNRSKGIWYCHACDIEGDAVEFVERHYGLRWGDACRKVIRDIRRMLESGNTDILMASMASGERIVEAIEDWKAIIGEQEKSSGLNKRAFIERQSKEEERHKDDSSLRSNKTSKNVRVRRKLEVAPITKAEQLSSYYMNFTQQAREYIKKRGIKADTAFYFGLGFDKKNDALVLPVRDICGKIVGRSYRSIMSSTKGFNKGFKKNENLFGLFEVAERAKKQGKIYVVEGYFDALLLFQEGVAAVAIGGTKLSEIQAELLAQVLGHQVKIIVVPDNDIAGERGAKKSLVTLSKYFIKLAINRVKAGFIDVSEYLCKKKYKLLIDCYVNK